MRIVLIGLFLILSGAEARLVRILVEHREPAKAGEYEVLRGRYWGELDPKDPHNQTINDIGLAVRNGRGLVEYTATFALAKPIDMKKASSLLLYGVPNRGKGAPVPSAEGHVNVVSGWQGDVASGNDAQTIVVPVAKNADGSPVVGSVTALFMDARAGTHTLPLSAAVSAISYQLPRTLDTTKATLTRRASVNGVRTPVDRREWAFADCGDAAFPGRPERTKICLKDGFDPAWLYELIYEAQDPLVLGIGYAATRDLNSFLRYEARDSEGTENPVAGAIRFAVSEGNSQSGNFLRSFVHLGFNQDERGRQVWDGMNPNIAARQLAMNFRFAVAGGTAKLYEPGSDGVVWWNSYADQSRGRKTAGLLDRCRATKTCPKIVETFGGLEFWALRMSPDLVGTDAKKDIPLPENVRRYYFPGTTHGGGRGGFNVAPAAVPAGCVLAANPNPSSDTLRALRVALIEWVMKGIQPPLSRYPTLQAGQLVAATQAATGFPKIPGIPSVDGVVNPVYDYDFGAEFRAADMAGWIGKAPPAIRRELPTLVPKVDADGNDLGGVASVLFEVPLGTYTGWNVTRQGFQKGQWCGLSGGYIPFARTKAERLASGDPRLSLEERYGTQEKYVERVKAAAARAVKARYLLAEDAARLVAQAEASGVIAKAKP